MNMLTPTYTHTLLSISSIGIDCSHTHKNFNSLEISLTSLTLKCTLARHLCVLGLLFLKKNSPFGCCQTLFCFIPPRDHLGRSLSYHIYFYNIRLQQHTNSLYDANVTLRAASFSISGAFDPLLYFLVSS
jgi:hypothetical protein